MISKSTRRSATFQALSGLVTAIAIAGCSGKLPLRYGETLCDSAHPCPDGFACQDSLCVPSSSQGDTIIDVGDDRPPGEWDQTDNQPSDVDTSELCRSDEQCGNNELCRDGVCILNPCAGILCPEQADICQAQCIPLSTACNGVHCVDNLEHCVDGQCVPSCAPDPCASDPQCDVVNDPNCDPGTHKCVAGTTCFNSVCYDLHSDCGSGGDLFCPQGFYCQLGCAAPDPCSTISCAAGFSCQVNGGVPDCFPNECTGLVCPAGQTCISGSCVDQCAFIACADGGRLCDDPNSVCCNGTCCPTGELCRVIDPDKPGVCLDAPGFCDPACGPDEVCVDSVCVCNTYPDPHACAAGQCCESKTCDTPCTPNPCSGANPLCSVDCTQPGGFKCVSGCGGVDCSTRANTACDPVNGNCTCDLPPPSGPSAGYNPQVCTSGSCCVANPGDAGHFFCDDPCQPNPCTSGSNTKCNIDCSNSNGFTCTNPCDGVVCTLPNTVCDSATGLCECGGTFCAAGGNNCCVGGTTCEDPCTPNPCGGQQCLRDCTQAGGFTCKNNCVGVNCPNPQNPDCDPLNGQCECQSDANGSFAACGASQCCSATGTCFSPCSPNPCSGGLKCNPNCGVAGGFTCTDPCAGNNCNSSTKGSDPDCRPVSGAAQCYCAGTGTVCNTTSQCCVEGASGACISPCTPNNCPNDPGAANSGQANLTKCVVDCLGGGANDYHCADPCQGVTCTGNNPNCHASPTDPNSAQCYCATAPGGAQCSGNTCCLSDGCHDPCVEHPCLSTQTCTTSCGASDGTGRVCTDKCPPGHCSNPVAPTCDPNTGNCSCNGATCGGSQCCIGGTTCNDPCASNPCGSTGVCTRDCTKAQGYTCNNQCNGVTCSNQNPDCDPTQQNPALRCTCNLTDICNGSECCVSDVCNDVCGSGDPCTSGSLTKCNTDCSSAGGFGCSDPCSGNSCNHAGTNNPQCRSSGAKGDSSQCYCAASNSVCSSGQCCLGGSGCTDPCASNPCSASQGKCVADCTQAQGFVCQPQACASSCVAPAQCDLRTGTCDCGTLGTDPMPGTCEPAPVHVSADGKNVCCFASPSDQNLDDASCVAPQCNSASDCHRTSGTGACVCDPCTGCTGGGEGSCAHN